MCLHPTRLPLPRLLLTQRADITPFLTHNCLPPTPHWGEIKDAEKVITASGAGDKGYWEATTQSCNHRPVLLERTSPTGPTYRQRQGGSEWPEDTAQWAFMHHTPNA